MKKNKILFLIPIVLLILIIIFWSKVRNILLELLLGSLLAYMLEPAVCFLTRKNKVKRGTSIFIVLCILLLSIVSVFIFIIPLLIENISDIINRIPVVTENLITKLSNITNNEAVNQKILGVAEHIYERLNSYISTVGTNLSGYLFNIAGSIVEIIIGIVTTFVFTIYIMKDKRKIFHSFLGLFPFNWRENIKLLCDELGRILSKFLQGQILIALIVGLMETLGLMLLRVPYAVLLGIIGGISNLIPYFGPIIGAVPAVISALFVSPMKALWTLMIFVLAQQIDNNFLSPKIIEGNLGIHPITTIVVVFIGGEFAGLAGILLAVPVYAVVKCVLMRIVTAYNYQDK